MTSEDEQFEQRKANLEALKALGVEAYPHKFERRQTISELAKRFQLTETQARKQLDESRQKLFALIVELVGAHMLKVVADFRLRVADVGRAN